MRAIISNYERPDARHPIQRKKRFAISYLPFSICHSRLIGNNQWKSAILPTPCNFSNCPTAAGKKEFSVAQEQQSLIQNLIGISTLVPAPRSLMENGKFFFRAKRFPILHSSNRLQERRQRRRKTPYADHPDCRR
jgi:hypothetical protein